MKAGGGGVAKSQLRTYHGVFFPAFNADLIMPANLFTDPPFRHAIRFMRAGAGLPFPHPVTPGDPARARWWQGVPGQWPSIGISTPTSTYSPSAPVSWLTSPCTRQSHCFRASLADPQNKTRPKFYFARCMKCKSWGNHVKSQEHKHWDTSLPGFALQQKSLPSVPFFYSPAFLRGQNYFIKPPSSGCHNGTHHLQGRKGLPCADSRDRPGKFVCLFYLFLKF